MKCSGYFISLISIFCLQITCSNAGSSKVPGNSACGYFGSTKYFCGLPIVPVNDLPQECTSFIWMRIGVDRNLNIGHDVQDPDIPGYIQSLLSSDKPTFIIYGHEDVQDTVNMLSNNQQDGGQTARTEMTRLKSFLQPFQTISGLIIDCLTLEPNTTNTACLTENFELYLNEMKNTFPDYGIGLIISGDDMTNLFKQISQPEWLNFTDLDPYIDFYFLDAFDLNACTEEFKSGDTPTNGSAGQTLEKFVQKVVELGVPNEKIYIYFNPGPSAISSINNISWCDVSNQKLCAASSLDGFCVENAQSLHDKGLFTRDNAAGFIVSFMDLIDDPFGCCQCGTPYPGFHYLWTGFNVDSSPASCPLLDKS